jgi:hypothetical protein
MPKDAANSFTSVYLLETTLWKSLKNTTQMSGGISIIGFMDLSILM